MNNPERRKFVGQSMALAFAPWTVSFAEQNKKNNQFIHMVFFYLKENSEENRKKLISALKKLSRVKTIKMYNIGIPAPSERSVVVQDYSLSWVTFFKDRAGEEQYQIDPIHLKFVEELTPMLEKVVVYDTNSVIF